MTELPLVSIVVLTKNRAESLRRTLDALAGLTYSNYETIVVNNGSTDGTAAVIANYSVNPIFCPEPNISVCRQRGIEAAKGEIIAMCDDDCVPAQDWLNHLVAALTAKEEIALVGGEVINIGFPEEQRYKGRGKIARHGELKPAINPEEADYFGSANMAFRRSAFEAIAGYDLFFKNGYEEVDLIVRLRQAGFQTAYEPKASVKHYFTGINYKMNLFFSGTLFRLYFYFKHYCPHSFGSWLSFCCYEFFLLGKNLFFGVRKLGETIIKGEFKFRATLIWISHSLVALAYGR